MEATAKPAQPTRLAAGLSILGGALVVVAYFLPSAVTETILNPNGPIGPGSLTVTSAWQVLLRIAFGAPYVNSNGAHGTSPGSPLYAIALAMPLFMGALVALLGCWGLLTRQGTLRTAFQAAASVMVAALAVPDVGVFLGFANVGVFGFGEFLNGTYSPLTVPNFGLVDLGFVVFFFGMFIALGASFAMVLKRAP
jgi:hypothetical protein